MGFTAEELKNMTLVQLKQTAKEMNIKNVSAMKKAELIEAISAEEKEEAQREAELQFHQNLMRRFSNKNTAGG